MNVTEVSIHNVKSVVISDRRRHGEGTDREFYTREIVITNDRNESVTISLYSYESDEDEALKVRS